MSISSVNQVLEEGCCGRYIVLFVAVLEPESIEVTVDKAFQYSRGMCRFRWYIEV